MEHKVADCVHAEKVYQRIGIEHVSFGFAHLAVSLQQPRMAEYLLRKRKIQGHQENRPVNGMETDNVLSDQV